MADSSDPADLRPRLRTLEQIRNEALAKRDKLAHDMIAASSGPHGGSGSRGVQCDTRSKGLAWVQGGIDGDYMLPKLHPLFAELLLHGVVNVPSWKGEPKSDVEALEILDALLACCKGAIERTGSSLPRRIGEDEEAGAARAAADSAFAELRQLAADKLKGIERRIVELVCERGGAFPLADLAVDRAIQWSVPFDDAFNSARKRINAKIAKANWNIYRHDGKAKVKHLGRK